MAEVFMATGKHTKVVSNEQILGGTPVVEGTRVPADNVLVEVRSGKDKFEIFEYLSLPSFGCGRSLPRVGKIGSAAVNDPFRINERMSPDLAASFWSPTTAKTFTALVRRGTASGLVVVDQGGLEPEKQVEFFGFALDVIERMPDIVNRVVEVFSDGSVEAQLARTRLNSDQRRQFLTATGAEQTAILRALTPENRLFSA